MQMSWTLVVVWVLCSALLSAGFTLLALHFAFKYHIGPEIERKVESRLQLSSAHLEAQIRKGLTDALFAQPDAIRQRAKGIARAGFDLLGARRPPSEAE